MSVKLSLVLVISTILGVFSSATVAQQLTPEQMEEWLFDDSDSLIADVNEGELVFLKTTRDEKVHHHHNRMVISDSSLEDGWVKIEQCHRNLDPVGLAQILFGKERSRNLSVSHVENIGKAWVEENSIQLEDIRKQAVLCIKAETRTFVYNGDGTYSLRSGPFMRRFLDGYYPMRVTMDVQLESERLRYYQSAPANQEGFKVWRSDRAVHYEAWFEGRLNTEVQFHDLVIGDPVALRKTRGRLVEVRTK